eukprot:TRINITY_DN26_c0_g4_i1.p1 TRINITY_DN26_c0_g4~~TRINITY_DN26_c0_g4_i1.p1  ORF type:complete len:533 (-),score=161.59 TRINITY_DN26_c0_g4_i1:43-1641(-)
MATDEKTTASQNWDLLGLNANAAVQQLISGKSKEKVVYSDMVVKINKRGVPQNRVLMITDKAVYNMKSGDYSSYKRRIPLENIGAVCISSLDESKEFVIHVPDEYDYRYQSDQKNAIVDIIKTEFSKVTKRKLAVIGVKEASLVDVTVTRDRVNDERLMKRWQEMVDAMKDSPDFDPEDIGKTSEVEIGLGEEVVGLESFEPIRVLGRGAFGKVIQVRKKDTKKIYAMKILKKTMVFAKKQVEHTKAERQILEAFQHPFLMGLRFAFQTEARLYLILDFYRGGELFFHLRKMRKFPEEVARIYSAEIALAMGHLHTLDFIYRDLKPENILVDDTGHLVLTDFGLAKHLNPTEDAFSFVGTPEYLAPEIVQQVGHGKAVDWWCLGIFLYELTVGVTPFYSQKVDEMYTKIINAKVKYPPRLSEECRDLISKLLVRDPTKRLGSGLSGSLTDIDEIKAHKFFDGLDWDKLLKREIDPGYKPELSDDPEGATTLPGASNIPLDPTYVDPKEIEKLGAGKLEGWTFDSRKDELKKN